MNSGFRIAIGFGPRKSPLIKSRVPRVLSLLGYACQARSLLHRCPDILTSKPEPPKPSRLGPPKHRKHQVRDSDHSTSGQGEQASGKRSLC